MHACAGPAFADRQDSVLLSAEGSAHESQDGLGSSDDDPLAEGQPDVVGFNPVAKQNEVLRLNRDGEAAVGLVLLTVGRPSRQSIVAAT